MTNESGSEKRVLAVDPSRGGFGYVVLEGPRLLVDFGTSDAQGEKNAWCIRGVARLIELYRPDVMILEDSGAKGGRRRERVQRLIHKLDELARRHKVQVHRISRMKVRTVFAQFEASNKDQIARVIAERLPELASRVPPERKPWMSEARRMAIFDAAAFAITFFLLADRL
jgi:hypothetical protein